LIPAICQPLTEKWRACRAATKCKPARRKFVPAK